MAAERTKLTKKLLDSIAPGGRTEFYWDSEVKGLALRVMPARQGADTKETANKAFILQYRMGRGRAFPAKRILIDGYGAITLDQARERARDLWEKIRDKKDPLLERDAERREAESETPVTVAQLIDDYIKRRASEKKSGDQDGRYLNRDVRPAWGARRMDSIGRKDVIALLDKPKDEGKRVTANRLFAVVRQLFSFAVERDYLQASPVVKIKPPGGKEKARKRNLSPQEIAIAWQAIDKAAWEPGLKQVLRLLFCVPARRGEVMGLSVDEINEVQSLWHLPPERSKNGEAHIYPLPPRALAILAEMKPDAAGFYFTSPRTGKPYNGKSLDHAVRDLFKPRQRRKGKAPPTPLLQGVMQPFTPHDCRRTIATRLREPAFGVSRDTLKLLLGHLDRSVTGKHYDQWGGLPEKCEAMRLWSGYLDEIIAGQLPADNVVKLHKA